MSLVEILWELHQEKRINKAEAIAEAKQSRLEAAQSDLNRLRRRLDRQTLLCQALWELLAEKLGLTEEELLARMREIDRRDGREDGKIGARPLRCPECGRTTTSRRRTCAYCGAAMRREHLFE